MKLYKITILLAILIFGHSKIAAQGVLDNRYVFNDGIYLSAADYFADAPSIQFEEGNIPVAQYGWFNESQFRDITYINKEGKRVKLNFKDVWGIAIKGVPYIYSGFSIVKESDISFLANTIKKTRNLSFSEIIYVGNISLYYFKQEKWMIKSNTGTSEKITVKKIKENIKDDQELSAQFYTEKHKRKNKLAYIIRYNQKHPISLNQLAHN